MDGKKTLFLKLETSRPKIWTLSPHTLLCVFSLLSFSPTTTVVQNERTHAQKIVRQANRSNNLRNVFKHTKIDLFNQITNLIIKVSDRIYIPTYGNIIICITILTCNANRSTTRAPSSAVEAYAEALDKNSQAGRKIGARPPQVRLLCVGVESPYLWWSRKKPGLKKPRMRDAATGTHPARPRRTSSGPAATHAALEHIEPQHQVSYLNHLSGK